MFKPPANELRASGTAATTCQFWSMTSLAWQGHSLQRFVYSLFPLSSSLQN